MGNMWSAIPVALVCMIVCWSERKQGSSPQEMMPFRLLFIRPFVYSFVPPSSQTLLGLKSALSDLKSVLPGLKSALSGFKSAPSGFKSALLDLLWLLRPDISPQAMMLLSQASNLLSQASRPQISPLRPPICPRRLQIGYLRL